MIPGKLYKQRCERHALSRARIRVHPDTLREDVRILERGIRMGSLESQWVKATNSRTFFRVVVRGVETYALYSKTSKRIVTFYTPEMFEQWFSSRYDVSQIEEKEDEVTVAQWQRHSVEGADSEGSTPSRDTDREGWRDD